MTLDDSARVLVLTGVDGRVSFWSAAAEARFGWSASDTSGRLLQEFAEPSPAWTIMAELSRHEVSEPLENECRMRHKDGRLVETWLHTVPLRDGTGRLHGYLQIFRYLSEGKEAERTALNQANANVVPVPRPLLHNLNNLVTSIHSTLDLALRGDVPPATAAFLNQAQTSSRMVVQLVNSFRSIGRTPGTGPAPTAPGMAASAERTCNHDEPRSLEGRERIFLVEDDNGIRMLMRAILGYRGYLVTDVPNGMEALKKIGEAAEPFHLAILDVHMPGMSGPEVLARLRGKWPGIRALFVTGNIDEVAEGGDYGGNVAFLGKPFQNLELLQAVRRILDQPVGETRAQE